MTGRQIRLLAIPSQVQLFPWARANEVVSSVPETTERDSPLARAHLHRRPVRPGHTLPRLQVGRSRAKSTSQRLVAADRSAKCRRDVGTDARPRFALAGQGISAALLAAATAPRGFPAPHSPTLRFMKGGIYVCWEEWPGLGLAEESGEVQRHLNPLRLQRICRSSSETQHNLMISSRSLRKSMSLGWEE